jgi:ubiquinol-cytochrome c reductase cytochrome c1 subunit
MFGRFALGGTTALAGAGVLLGGQARADTDCLDPPHYTWAHRGAFSSFDAAGLRRGFEVYRLVCATCHSLDKFSFRNLVGVTHTEDQAKRVAAAFKIKDGPNDQGEMYERPGRLTDGFPKPYENKEAGRYANNGAFPPDLSLMVKARGRNEDYIVALLTGYRDPPFGQVLRPGNYSNLYMPGGTTSMPKQLSDGLVDYEDGTPATETQMAKDVAIFLAWTAEPCHDAQKLQGVKLLTCLGALSVLTLGLKRWKWLSQKTRRITFIPPLSSRLRSLGRKLPGDKPPPGQ